MRIDVFTPQEVSAAQKIVRVTEMHKHADEIMEKIVTETVMDRINAETNQKNDRRYIAYRLEYIATTHASQPSVT